MHRSGRHIAILQTCTRNRTHTHYHMADLRKERSVSPHYHTADLRKEATASITIAMFFVRIKQVHTDGAYKYSRVIKVIEE